MTTTKKGRGTEKVVLVFPYEKKEIKGLCLANYSGRQIIWKTS